MSLTSLNESSQQQGFSQKNSLSKIDNKWISELNVKNMVFDQKTNPVMVLTNLAAWFQSRLGVGSFSLSVQVTKAPNCCSPTRSAAEMSFLNRGPTAMPLCGWEALTLRPPPRSGTSPPPPVD
jgi:hypothetical protein